MPRRSLITPRKPILAEPSRQEGHLSPSVSIPSSSTSNPEIKKIQELEEKYGSLDKVPGDVEPLSKFVVMVKTTRYKKVDDVPSTAVRFEQQVQGLILNGINPLSYEERQVMNRISPLNVEEQALQGAVPQRRFRPSSSFWNRISSPFFCFVFRRMGLGVTTILVGPCMAIIGPWISERLLKRLANRRRSFAVKERRPTK